MPPFIIRFLDRSVAVDAPATISGDIAAFFQLAAGTVGADTPTRRAIIRDDSDGKFALELAGKDRVPGLTRGETLYRLAAEIGRNSYFNGPGVALHAGAVGWGEKAALVIGQPGGGKSSLVAWLVEKGFAYLADDSVVIPAADGTVAGFPEPPALRPGALRHFGDLAAFHSAPSLRSVDRLLVRPESAWLAPTSTARCGLVVVTSFQPDAALRLEPVAPAELTLRLLEATRRVILPSDPEYPMLVALGEGSLAVRLTYSTYAQLDGVLDFLARMALEADMAPAEFERFLRGLPQPALPVKFPIQAPTDRRLTPELTIGMATYDDFDGVYFTIQAIRLYHPEIVDQVEFLVVDNHPNGPCSAALKKLEESIPNYRYLPMFEATGTSQTRDRVFSEAQAPFVLCIDCHIFIVPGALRRLLAYFDANPDTADLLQGPILYDDLNTISTNYDPKWLAGFLGVWGNNPAGADPDAPPFEIAIQGLGLFACRKSAWPGFHPDFRGFGGEEGYIHEKFRRAGHRTLCMPFLRWVHRFPRPMGVPYPNIWIDRVRNYLIGHREFGLPIDEMQQHFRDVVGAAHADELFAIVTRELDDAARQ